MAQSHPGFKNVAASIAQRSELPIERARAILASRTRKASAKAVKKNPRLARVLGGPHSSVAANKKAKV